ncbi:nitronate monooxygenase [Oleiharenicola lentus]|uniref:Nitronate monooxygenase n=2 Tax=Oleiharenicola lentus TaxID=2508720 RepID=A0A4Q1C5Z0_9BACT|nr:nitronate monooxygenase [Oleiharenicola lentus]
MGVGVSGWRLARAVAQAGQLGVVSGTALPLVLARQLQLGDPDGDLARAAVRFPRPDVVERVWSAYFVPGGKPTDAPFKAVPMPSLHPSQAFLDLAVLAAFVEVALAKEGHAGPVGINLLEKIQTPTLPTLFGAMLAGVDYVLMGAGIPRAIPGVLDGLARGESVELKLDITGALETDDCQSRFDPRPYLGSAPPARPRFLPIISSATLALTLARKSNGRVDGFVVEGPLAGGHNAPPRGALTLTESGEPIYGPRDVPELPKIRDLGLPFWLAGSCADPGKLAEARAAGAAGVQVGTAFAFCEESGLLPDLKRKVCALSRSLGALKVRTDPRASPTGFPFKVLQLLGTLSDEVRVAARERICDLGYLRELYRKPDGSVGYRCAGEPVEDYVRKGGTVEDTQGRLCLCNGLMANIGLGQLRFGKAEDPLITAGDDVANLARFLPAGIDSYRAADVIRWLLGSPVVV